MGRIILNSSDQQAVLTRMRVWLGDDLYMEGRDEAYLGVFERINEAARGALPEDVGSGFSAIALPVLWETFVGVVEGGVNRVLEPHRPAGDVPRTLFPGSTRSRVVELMAATMRPKVSVNLAGIGELSEVLGIGERVAARIVARRQSRGLFASLDELEEITGFSRAARDRALPSLTLAVAAASGLVLPGAAVVMSFPDYIRLLARTGLRADGDASPQTAAALALSELRRIANEAGRSPFWRKLRRADLPDLQRRAEAELRRAQRPALRIGGDALKGVGLLRNQAYFELMNELIRRAVTRVWVQMFYFTSAETSSPGGALLAELMAAKLRGVDVRLILDTDSADDPHQAAEINETTISAVRAAGIECRLDGVGATTHSKAALIDDDQLVIGSHNWTTRAAYQLDETSLYIESTGAAAREKRRFEFLWAAYDPMEATRSFAFPLLRFLRREERTALDAAQLKDSAAFRLAYADEAAARAGAAALTVDAGRMEQFWRLLALMHRFGLPEPTAFALTLTSAHSPDALLALPRADVVAQLRKLPPLTGVYRSKTVRVDVVEVIS